MVRRKANKEDGEHEVSLTVTIAKASETDFDLLNDSQKRKGKLIEAPKAQDYFHCTYKMLPDDKESVKTDIVTYGIAAKLYTDSDSRVLRTWVDGGKTWVAWTNNHKVKVTKDVLLKMFNHSLELKIWDSKDKVSPRARFDRPKGFKLPQSRGNEEFDIENVKKLLRKHGTSKKEASQISEALSPDGHQNASTVLSNVKEITKNTKPRSEGPNTSSHRTRSLSTNKQRNLGNLHENDVNPKMRSPRGFNDVGPTTPVGGTNDALQVKVFLNEKKEPQMGNLMKLAASGIKLDDDDDDEMDETELMIARQTASHTGKRSSSTGRSSKSKSVSTDRKVEARAAFIKSHGLASVSVRLSAFFTGTKFISNRLASPIGTIEDLVITLSLDGPLLSEPQRKALNPMVIRVLSVNNMPSRPLSFSQLQHKCVSPYVSYKFHNQPVHKSCTSFHASKIHFDDAHVVLLGTEEKETLFEYLRGPGLEIEVHDRDRDTIQKDDVPTIFGEHEDDLMINKASLVTGRRTEHNPFTGKGKIWDPYGVAKIDLSDFLLGEKIIELSVPIRGCKGPDIIDGRGSGNSSEKIVGEPGSVDGPEDLPLPAANYIEAGSELKAKIELAYPLKTTEEVQLKRIVENPKECPFGRLVYIFDYQNKAFLQKVQYEVLLINAETLQLKEFPQHVIEAALSTYKLTESQRWSKTLNIITGFQIIDGKHHIFVLEGLRDHGMKTLWDNLPQPNPGEGLLTSLYNTDITFQERVYASLDVDLTRVRLHQPLDAIVKLPLLYVRDMVPRPCFEAVLKLYDLVNCQRLRDAVRNDLFPTDEMIASLSKEFGIPLTTEDLQEYSSSDGSELREGMPESVIDGKGMGHISKEDKSFKTSRQWTPLQLKNEVYDEMLQNRVEKGTRTNFMAENISRIRQLAPIRRERTITCDPTDLPNQEAHNYSIQSLNTTELAKRKLRGFLAEDPEFRYTYSQGFNSATVLPVDLSNTIREELHTSRKEWQTPEGFVFPGRKTSQESNKNPKEPDFARLDELKKPWRENILHANKLKPTVDRLKFSWEERRKDFDVLTRPREFFGKSAPVTIHLAGDALKTEQKRAAEEEQNAWKKSIVVEDTLLKTHRCATQTELISKGFKSSSQLSRLGGLLKNEPRKYALSAPGLRLDKIPSLSVVVNPNIDTSLSFCERLNHASENFAMNERTSGYRPGPFDARSWLLEKNNVPTCDYNHSYFEKQKGADFRPYYSQRDLIYRRPIKPLSTDETALLRGQPTETV